MKKSYLFADKYEIPLYRGKIVIILSNSSDEVRRIIPEFDAPDLFAHTQLFKYTVDKFEGEEGYGIILNFNHETNYVTHGTIAHEAYHVVSILANRRGFIPDFENDEPVSYLIEWVVNRIMEVVSKNNFKVKSTRK